MSGVVNYASTDATSVDDLSLPWSDPPERRPLPRSRSTSPAGPPCLRGFLLPVIHRLRSAGRVAGVVGIPGRTGGPGWAEDDPGVALVGPVRPGPVGQHRQPAAGADQERHA